MAGEKMARNYYGENYDRAMENYKVGVKTEKALFLKKYPKANLSKFEFDVTVGKTGKITEKNIFYKINDQDSLNITSPVFQTSFGVHSLGLGLRDTIIFSKFGDKNYGRFETAFNAEVGKLQNNFSDKYPHANLSKFTFNVNLNQDLSVESTSIFYKSSEDTSWDITSDTFKDLYTNSLFWSPRIWGSRGSVQPLNMLDPKVLGFELTRFKIYVNVTDSFTSNFLALNTAWENKSKNKNITKAHFDYKTDPYFTSLLAAYVISYESGISLKHLKYDPGTPKIITSIARYFIYFHMKRFLKYPDKLDYYVNKSTISFVQENIPTRQIWVKKLDQTQERMNIWLAGKKTHVRGYHFVLGNNPAQGVYGISYQELAQVVNTSDQDWIKFLKSDSDGLTKVGQKLFQHAIESYVYCILGSQAQTHWPIVGAGAKSLQTQDIFHKLVLDTIAQDNAAVAISNMRRAIKDTNVILNMVVSPGIILVPSSLIIQKEMLRGYNNELTLATNNMKFGENKNINYSNVTPVNTTENPRSPAQSGAEDTQKNRRNIISSDFSTTQEKSFTNSEGLVTIFGSMIVVGLLIAKYLL